MAKKHQKAEAAAPMQPLSHAAEYRIIKHDLLRVVALNTLYLVVVLAIYYSNQKTQYLDRLLSHWFHL